MFSNTALTLFKKNAIWSIGGSVELLVTVSSRALGNDKLPSLSIPEVRQSQFILALGREITHLPQRLRRGSCGLGGDGGRSAYSTRHLRYTTWKPNTSLLKLSWTILQLTIQRFYRLTITYSESFETRRLIRVLKRSLHMTRIVWRVLDGRRKFGSKIMWDWLISTQHSRQESLRTWTFQLLLASATGFNEPNWIQTRYFGRQHSQPRMSDLEWRNDEQKRAPDTHQVSHLVLDTSTYQINFGARKPLNGCFNRKSSSTRSDRRMFPWK